MLNAQQPSRRRECKPPQNLRRILLSLLALPILSVGCSTPLHTIASGGSTSVIGNHTGEALIADDDSSVSSIEYPSPVRTVTHQSDKKGAAGGTSDEAVQLASPLDLESLPVPHEPEFANGLTLEAIEQMALANNPAIKQASAASARAGGIRTQVGITESSVMT